jgi:hypothetical protein
MTRFVRMSLFSALMVGLAACGGGAKLGGGKEGAAQAVFQASQPAGRSGSTNGQALLAQALASGASSISVTASCSKGGSATLALDVDETVTDPDAMFSLTYDITYNDCNEDGKNSYDGTMRTTMNGYASSDGNMANFSMSYTMKGRLDISGEVSDFVDADITMTMSATASSTHTGSVAITIDGTITTSTLPYVYNNERINITAGELPRS